MATWCVARPEPRFSALGKVRRAEAGDRRGLGLRVRPLGPGAMESPGRTPSLPKCILVSERSGRAGLPWENLAPQCRSAGRSPECPGNTGPGRGSASDSGPRLAGLRTPSRPLSLPGLGGGKKRADSSWWKKKKNLGNGSRSLPAPHPRPSQPSQQILS